MRHFDLAGRCPIEHKKTERGKRTVAQVLKKLGVACAVVACLAVIVSTSACALNLDLLIPVAPADAEQYDFATTSGAAHVVYKSGSNVYYATITKDNMNWTIRNLGAGNWPTIATNKFNQLIVAYENGGTIYEVGPHNNWTPTAIMSGIAGGKPVLSSPFFASGWQMIVTGNYDGDSYAEVVRLSNSGSGWSSPELLFDGWFMSGMGGTYYGQASIAAFADGSYAVAREEDYWGGNASWSSKWAGVSGIGSSSIGVSTGWNSSISLSRRAVSAISEDGSPAAVFACAVDGRVYVALNEGSGWTWILNGSNTGSAPSVTWTGGVYADANGVLQFVTSNEQGLVIDPLVYEGTQLTGSRPLVWAMEDKFFLYRDSSGVLQLGASFVNVVPEPTSCVSLLIGLGSSLGTVALRRRHR